MGDSMGDFVDFADISNQINRRESAKIHTFNIMIIGRNGEGKSSLVKSLFRGRVKPEHPEDDSVINKYEVLLDEMVKIRVRCVETSNYNEHVDGDYVNFIDEQLKSFFIKEQRMSVWNIDDYRIHCCIYMIPPYTKVKLRKSDIECMKALHSRVNLVPVIARSDTVEPRLLPKFKENIRADLERHGIEFFEFFYDAKEDEAMAKFVKSRADRFPFAIISVNEPTTKNDGKTAWVRETVAGHIDIMDKDKCDFEAFSNLITRHCTQELIDSTHIKHYAKFKAEALESARKTSGDNLRKMGLESHEVKRIILRLDKLKTLN